MYVKVYDCNASISGNHMVDNYTDIYKSTCSFCDAECDTPDISSTINFFDGFNGKDTLIVYCSLIAFSIIFELFR